MHRRPSIATVIATLALLVSLSGTAMAAAIITKNSQVGAHTISGAVGPSGDNKNLIAGSVGSPDLHTGAITGTKLAADSVNSSKVADGSLTGSDVAPNTITPSNLDLPGVAKGLTIDRAFSQDAPGAAADAFFTVGPWTLTGNCIDDGSGNAHATIDLTTTLPALLSVDSSAGARFTGTASTHLAATPTSASTKVQGGNFTASLVSFSNHLEGQVMAAVDVDDGSPFCNFTFSGLGN